jgi:hypothetical protein
MKFIENQSVKVIFISDFMEFIIQRQHKKLKVICFHGLKLPKTVKTPLVMCPFLTFALIENKILFN